MKVDLATKFKKIMKLKAYLQLKGQEHTKKEEHEDETINLPTQVTNELVATIISKIDERDLMEQNKQLIRIGGTLDDWTQA